MENLLRPVHFWGYLAPLINRPTVVWDLFFWKLFPSMKELPQHFNVGTVTKIKGVSY
jgi:hypothetical protein